MRKHGEHVNVDPDIIPPREGKVGELYEKSLNNQKRDSGDDGKGISGKAFDEPKMAEKGTQMLDLTFNPTNCPPEQLKPDKSAEVRSKRRRLVSFNGIHCSSNQMSSLLRKPDSLSRTEAGAQDPLSSA